MEVTTFTLAIDRRPDKDGTTECDFIICAAFGKLAENTCKYVEKGRLVAVEGR